MAHSSRSLDCHEPAPGGSLFVRFALALALCSACRFGFEAQVAGDAAAVPPLTDDGGLGGADSGAFDSATAGLACPSVDGDTVALYPFDGDTDVAITDAAGAHPGRLTGASATRLVPGPAGCGVGLEFPADDMVYVEIDNSPDFDLPVGALDVWVRPAPPEQVRTPYVAIVGRDAIGTQENGHFTLMQWDFGGEYYLVAKIQMLGEVGEGLFLCADQPLVPGEWTHVGINLGGPQTQMFINGVLAVNTESHLNITGQTFQCNGDNPRGIDGNSNPWGLGVDSGRSSDGALNNLQWPFSGGAIDHVRLSRERRDFAAMFGL